MYIRYAMWKIAFCNFSVSNCNFFVITIDYTNVVLTPTVYRCIAQGWKKLWGLKWQWRNICDGTLMAKIQIMMMQGNFVFIR